MKKITLFLFAITMSLLSFAQSQMSGTYTVGTGGSYDYSSMADAGMAIKAAEFTGDVTLLICTDLTETINTGIVNKSNYTLTIRPDKDENRTITYTTAKDNTGPTGVFVIGGDMTKTPGTTIGWASVPTKNVIVDGAAEGKTTPRLKITTGKFGTGFLIYGDVQDCVVKNCILENTGTATANYALTFRSENYSQTSKNIGPKNCVVENCILEATHASKSQTVYFRGDQANSAAGYPSNITIRNCNIKAHTRGMFLYGVNGLNVEGCTFDMSDMASGLMCHGILGNTVKGTINVKGNKFIKNSTKNTYAGEYGLQTITASGGATEWVIENNYFAGYDALASGTTSKESRLVGIRCGDYCVVRHNTFHMPKLTYAPGTSLVGTHAVALLWLAGSHKYPVQNNIFVCEETTANVSLIRGGLNENVTGNVFYHKGGNAAIVAAAPSCMIFADLETSYPTQAATSKWTNVIFADAANGDLSLAGSSDGDLNLAVDRLAEVLTDINGKTRAEKTYAGAYEGGEFPAEVCTVTAIVEPIGSGTVEGMGDHEKGTSVTLTPVPSTGYEFVDWKFEDATTSTDNPLTLMVNSDITVTANFAKKQYTLTVQANDPTKGSVALDPASGIYEYETEVTLTATANDGYEFVNWSNGSTDNPLTMTVTGEETITANFRAILASSITLNAHPVKDYSASIVGTMKRAIQNGENTIILTHEANGTAHIYNIAHATKTITEISQEGVVAVDPDNAGDFLAISDIALTADGKLVACNYMLCQNTASYVDAGYKRGTTRFYIWDEIDGDPTLWFTSQQSVNYYRAKVGYTMALKGTSDDAWVLVAGFNNNATGPARFDHYHIVNGSKSTTSPSKAANMSYSAIGSTYEISASPLADGNWVLDGELAVPTEFVESKDNQEMTIFTPIAESVLGKKYNGATYLANYNDHHLMVAPYANGDGKLAGVKVLGISDGFDAATLVTTTATDLTTPIDATRAAATAYVDGDGDLTIYLIADGKVYTFSEKEFTTPQYSIDARADHTSKGYVTGGGDYYEGEEVVLKATAKSGYYFTQWNDGNTDNPRTITVDGDKEYIAEFAEAHPRAWAYDMKLGEDGDNYTFTFKATAAGQATITFKDKDGNALAQPASQTMATVIGENKFTIAKSDFESGVDAFWFITMDGDPIPAIAEVTDQTRGIYDFYNMMGVVVDNNTDSKDFGKIYVQASLNGKSGGITDRAKEQKAGIFIYNQDLDELNDPSNTGYKPTVPSGYTEIGSSYSAFQRLNIHPKTGDLVYSHAIADKPAVFAINRDDMTGAVTNLLTGVADMTRSVAHCFDADGTLFVMDFAENQGAVYKVINGDATRITEISSKFINAHITMASDGRGGLWISQNRAQMDGAPYYYQLVHVNNVGEYDWAVNKETPHDFVGSSSRGALAYDADRQILAQGRNGKVELYTVSYAPNITLTPLYTIANDDLGNNIDGLAFDYAGDLYVVNSSKEKFQKFSLPTADNICTVAAPALEAVRFTPVYTVSVASNNNEWGIANGGGTFEKDQSATITAVAATNYKFVNWTKGGTEVSTENPYTFSVTETATYTANFVEKTKYTIEVTYDNTMGTVSGADSYYEGTEVTLTATANPGYRFINWTKGAEVVSTDATYSFTVTENTTLIANFEPVQYTLIAPTNDENKGTVTGAGTYNYGTEVILTATPKEGYKLLYWSDRSTENPRTITMNKDEAISAYFVKEYDMEPSIKIEKVWENTNVPTSTTNGYQAVGWDGKVYLQASADSKIMVYDGTGEATEYATSGTGHQIAVDEVGNLIVYNGYFATATPNNILIYAKGSTTGKELTFTLPNSGRCDFFSASGDIYSAEGGYVYFYCNNQTVVNRIKIANGAIITIDVVGKDLVTGCTQNNVIKDIFGNLVAHSRLYGIKALNVITNEASDLVILPNLKTNTLGGCTFELGGKELWAYNVGSKAYNSEWNLYNVTDKESITEETLCALDKTTINKNQAANWLNVQVVDEKTAYIYQYCPTVAAAVWKVTCTTEKTVIIDEEADNTTALAPYEGELVDKATVKRNFEANKCYTLTLPFDMSAAQISTAFGNATVYEFYNIVENGSEELYLEFVPTSSIQAGEPCLIVTPSGSFDANDGFEVEDVIISTNPQPVQVGAVTMMPVLDNGYEMTSSDEYYVWNGGLYCAGTYNMTSKGLRAYFTSSSPLPLRSRVVLKDNEATSIPLVGVGQDDQVRKIMKDGQIIIIRGEEQYNIQGQTID